MKQFLVLTTLIVAISTMATGADVPTHFPWNRTDLPQEIKESALIPDRVTTEKASDWRTRVGSIFRPLVKNCSTAREAVLTVAANMTRVTGVYYSTERRKPDMNPIEALTEKKVSCTGQSILMVCALRSIGIPARAVGVATWNHIQGNHTWAEAWFDGGWHMIEFNEKDFNTPWVMENIGMLNTRLPWQRIYAFKEAPENADNLAQLIEEDVTERYMGLARQWYKKSDIPANTQRLMLDAKKRQATGSPIELVDQQGTSIGSTQLPTLQCDMRQFGTLNLPRTGTHFLRYQGKLIPVKATTAPVQIIRL